MYHTLRYAHDGVAYECEEWSRPDEMALFAQLWAYTRSQLDVRPHCRLLDLCCGSGMSLLGAISHPHLKEAIGIDISHRLVDFAARRFAVFNKVHFVCCDAVQSCFQEHTFDLLVASSAYHHILPHLKRSFLTHCRALLRPDGRLLVGENILPEYENLGSSYDHAVRTLYETVTRDTLSKYPYLPATILDMLDENVRLSLARQYEFKVDYRTLMDDLSAVDLEVEEQTKVWPSTNDCLGSTAGNFVFVIKQR